MGQAKSDMMKSDYQNSHSEVRCAICAAEIPKDCLAENNGDDAICYFCLQKQENMEDEL